MTIRTPDQRLRVFVSSTLGELAPERHAVRQAIEGLRLTPVMFEHGARPHPPRALYRAYLEQSDVFIGLYWERYGWVAPDETVSGLEDEYRLSNSMPRLIYLKEPAAEREVRLEKLIQTIRADDRVSYRSFGGPDELRVLVADDLALLLTERFSSTTPAAAPARPSPRRALPRPLTRLIGRDAELKRLAEMLADPDVRLVTLLGPGGIGKTRLGLAVANRVADRYPNGLAYVDLAALNEPTLVLSAIAEAVGLREAAGRSIGIGLREHLAEARMLIVLDNLEQLLDSAPDLGDLLAAAPGVDLLVTSRRVLNVRGETTFDVEPLAVTADSGGSPTAHGTSAAVELFVDRARGARPGYTPTGAELAAIEEICARLDGLPLAIELASARVRMLSAQAILSRMGHRRLPFLRGGARDLPRRQQALVDAIAWSHSLLENDAQTLFARLSVFVGSASLEAIEQVANPDGRLDTLDLIAVLVDSSLVRPAGDAAAVRFRMLETIREYAVERLEDSGEAEELRRRHEAYYSQLAEDGDDGLASPRQIHWLHRLTQENDNLRAVLRRALRRGDATAALRVARLMASYWQIRSAYSEGRRWADAIQRIPGATAHQRHTAWIIGALLGFWQGDTEALDTDLEDVIRVAQAAGDRRALGVAYLAKALQAAMGAGDPDGARDAVTAAASVFEAAGDRFYMGVAQFSRAYVAGLAGRLDEAVEGAETAYALSLELGEWYIRAIACTILARAATLQGDSMRARRYAREALIGGRQLGNLSAVAYALELLAATELPEGNEERAARLFALSMRAYRESGSRPWQSEGELHRWLQEQLRASFGDRLDRYLAEAMAGDLDGAIRDLIEPLPATGG